jgi:hypothetical protein
MLIRFGVDKSLILTISFDRSFSKTKIAGLAR